MVFLLLLYKVIYKQENDSTRGGGGPLGWLETPKTGEAALDPKYHCHENWHAIRVLGLSVSDLLHFDADPLPVIRIRIRLRIRPKIEQIPICFFLNFFYKRYKTNNDIFFCNLLAY